MTAATTEDSKMSETHQNPVFPTPSGPDGASSEDELDEALADINDDEPGPSTFSAAQPTKSEPIPTFNSTIPPPAVVPLPSTAAFPHPESSWAPSLAAGTSRSSQMASTSSSFKAPPNPHIPQDLSLIAEMVGSHQVVGALPPLHMTAAEKRRLVEESIRKGKSKAVEPDANPLEISRRGDDVSSEDSDSSSEFLSDDEEERPSRQQSMTEAEHADIKAGLDKLVNGNSLRPPPGPEVESDSEDTSDYISDDDEDDIAEVGAEVLQGAGTGRGKITLEGLMDDEEDGGGGGPIVSTHEAPLPPVSQPPVRQLPSTEKFTLAGDVVSWMRDKKVEAWVEKQSAPPEATAGDAEVENGEVVEAPLAPPPNFSSSGTVVIRAMQERPGVDGWLEEGSVLCWQDGRVLGTVADTFGPLPSPFYLVRLPPPPHPYPSGEDLASGTRIFYPSNPTYRRFVDMHAVRDPRFKGSDASNFHDEEVGEDEMEWSDDEAEAEARRRRKNKRSGSAASRGGRGGGPRGGHGVNGSESHFDYQPSGGDEDAGSLYGGKGEEFDDGWSDAGSSYSTASGRGRAMPAPYEVDDTMSGDFSGGNGGGRPARDEGWGRGRGQGRQRGRGRGGGQDGRQTGNYRGGGGGRGGRVGGDRRTQNSPRGTGNGSTPYNGLPARPMEAWSPASPSGGQTYPQDGYPSSMAVSAGAQNGQYGQGWVQPPIPPSQYSHYAPPTAAPFFPAPMSSWAPPSPGGSAGGPAINPRFAAAAAQYSQMLQQPPWGPH